MTENDNDDDEPTEELDEITKSLLGSLSAGDVFSVFNDCFCRHRSRAAPLERAKLGVGVTVPRGTPIVFELYDKKHQMLVGFAPAREGVCLIEVPFKKAGRL